MPGQGDPHIQVLLFRGLGDNLIKSRDANSTSRTGKSTLSLESLKRHRTCCTADPRHHVGENQKTRKNPGTLTQSRKRRSVESKALLCRRLGVAVYGRGISIIPIPREATSVATMMGLFPVLNSFKTQSRSFCCLSPWMARIVLARFLMLWVS